MTTYAKYYKKNFPVGNCFNDKDQKLIESAQCGIGDENTLRIAVANADAGDLIVLAPTTITLTSQLVINKPLVIRGTSSGEGGTRITGAFGSELVSINLNSFSSTAEVSFRDITFKQGSDDTDVIAVDNTNAGAALNVRFHHCNISVYDASADAFALDVAHTVTTQAINLHVAGDYDITVDAINFVAKNASDHVVVEGVKMQKQGKSAALTTSTDNLAAQVKLLRCQGPHEAMTAGGHASQLLIAVGCISVTGTTYAAADTSDFTGSHTETIIG